MARAWVVCELGVRVHGDLAVRVHGRCAYSACDWTRTTWSLPCWPCCPSSPLFRRRQNFSKVSRLVLYCKCNRALTFSEFLSGPATGRPLHLYLRSQGRLPLGALPLRLRDGRTVCRSDPGAVRGQARAQADAGGGKNSTSIYYIRFLR